MEKKILRIILKVVYLALLGYILISIFTGKYTTLTYYALGAWIGATLAWIIWYAINKINYGKLLFKYKQVFRVLQDAHRERYKAYLNADEEAIKEYQDYVEISSIALLETGNVIKNDKWATEEQRKEVQEIMNKSRRTYKNNKTARIIKNKGTSNEVSLF